MLSHLPAPGVNDRPIQYRHADIPILHVRAGDSGELQLAMTGKLNLYAAKRKRDVVRMQFELAKQIPRAMSQ